MRELRDDPFNTINNSKVVSTYGLDTIMVSSVSFVSDESINVCSQSCVSDVFLLLMVRTIL